jgi:conjugal transfer mating pair stabilization protein TraN
MRTLVIWFTVICFLTTQTAAVAGPHEEGVAAGQAANPVARGSVTTPSASAIVPGYTTTPPETAHYRQPNLAAQGNTRLALCASMPNDPVCQALRGAALSANTPRTVVTANDPSVATAHAIARSPSGVLENLASYYSGCTTTTTSVPAGTQTRSCLRYEGAGNYRCARTLTVGIERSVNCTPGDWFVQASSGGYTFAVQCVPDRPESAQHFRIVQDDKPPVFFKVDMTRPAVFPEMAVVLDTSPSMLTGQPIRTGIWIVDQSCTGETCRVTALIAAEKREVCSGSPEAGHSCTSVAPFLKRYAACRPGTQSGDNIWRSVCMGDNDCVLSTLDPTKCYAPTDDPTPYTGGDVTGLVEGYYWDIDADRAVNGWDPNPAYGPIPTMRLTYTKPRTSYTSTDRWDDQCPALPEGGRCTAIGAAACADGPATKLIDGIAVTRGCWRYERALTCSAGAPLDHCAQLAAQGCTASGSACRRTNPATGACEVQEDTYQCPAAAGTSTSVSNCPSTVFCLQGSCFDISYTNDADFARSMSMLEAVREAGVYLDTDRMQVFKGEENRCRDRLLKNCCYADGAGAGMTNQSVFGTGSRLVYDILMNPENQQFIYQGLSALLMSGGFSGSFTAYGVTVAVNGAALPAGSVALYSGESIVVAFDPWSLIIAIIIYIILSMMSCNEQEGRLAMMEGARLCHTVGTWCSSCLRVHGSCVSCVEHMTSKCCFNSVLARIVNEQGRMQVGKGWGSAQSADCSGFTVAQLQSLDFARMDLSEFYASLVPMLPDVGALQNNGTGRVPACYYGQGKC